MSQLDDLKEQLKSRGQELIERIKESEAYNQLNEKYLSLSSTGQKGVQVGGVIIVLFLILYSPLSQIEFSNTVLQEFQSTRNLIRDLFKTYRESSAIANIPQPPQSFEIINSIQSSLAAARLIPEQIISVADGSPIGKLIPAQLTQSVIEVKLAKLNLRQIVEIGTRLVNLSAAVKVKDMNIVAHPDMPGYFNVNYTLYALKVPAPIIEAPEPLDDQPKKNKKNKAGIKESVKDE